MISPFFVYLWFTATPPNRLLLEEPKLPAQISRSITHLRSFFDARSLAAGEALYPLLAAIMPQIQPSEPLPESSSEGVVIDPSKDIKKPAWPNSVPILAAPSPDEPSASAITGKHQHSVRAATPASLRSVPAAHTPAISSAANPNVEDRVVNLNLVGTPLNAALSAMMSQTGVNLLLIADPAKTITLVAKNRRFIDALSDICAITDLSYLKVGGEYVVASDEKLKSAYHDAYAAAHPDKAVAPAVQPDIVTETYHTNYCDAVKLIASIKDTFKDSELSMIAAPASASQQLAMQDESSKSGVSSTVLGSDEQSDKVSRLIVLQGTRSSVNAAISLLKKLDMSPSQVNIAVTINDLSLDAEKNLGVDWGGSSSVSINENTPSGIGFAPFTRTPLSFQATINYLQSKGQDKLLASPNITVQDGQRAYILVGQRLEFPVVSSIQENGQPLYNVDEERVGIYLQVAVWVTNDGRVKMILYPQVSTVTGFITVNGGQYPQISTREAQTTLSVQSGHTILIGGLIHDEDIVNMSKVPILSQIPILGELFTNRDHQRTRDEVVISITPTITPNP